MLIRTRRFSSLMVLAALALSLPAAYARNKQPKAADIAPKDEIEVVGHIPATDGPVKRFFTTQHYSSYYLYAEHEAGKGVTLIDVTKTNHPAVLADVALPSSGASGNLSVVAGTAALMSSESAAPAQPSAPQTIRIMDFSEPRNPKVVREFAGVSAMSRDDRRGLIFVANAEGIWILRQRLAEDPEVMKEYDRYILYSH